MVISIGEWNGKFDYFISSTAKHMAAGAVMTRTIGKSKSYHIVFYSFTNRWQSPPIFLLGGGQERWFRLHISVRVAE